MSRVTGNLKNHLDDNRVIGSWVDIQLGLIRAGRSSYALRETSKITKKRRSRFPKPELHEPDSLDCYLPIWRRVSANSRYGSVVSRARAQPRGTRKGTRSSPSLIGSS